MGGDRARPVHAAPGADADRRRSGTDVGDAVYVAMSAGLLAALAAVAGSGEGGIITRDDVQARYRELLEERLPEVCVLLLGFASQVSGFASSNIVKIWFTV